MDIRATFQVCNLFLIHRIRPLRCLELTLRLDISTAHYCWWESFNGCFYKALITFVHTALQWRWLLTSIDWSLQVDLVFNIFIETRRQYFMKFIVWSVSESQNLEEMIFIECLKFSVWLYPHETLAFIQKNVKVRHVWVLDSDKEYWQLYPFNSWTAVMAFRRVYFI